MNIYEDHLIRYEINEPIKNHTAERMVRALRTDKAGTFVSSKFRKSQRMDERKYGYSYCYYSFTFVLIRVSHFLAH